jgi:hypothetical protein
MWNKNMDAKTYIDEIVEPTIREYEADPTCRRRAFLACVAAYHTIDYMGKKSLRQQFRRECDDFRIVDKIAHAFKHVETDGQRRIAVRDIVTRPPAMLGVMAIGLSRIGDYVGGVTLRNDVAVDVLASLRNCMAFLRGKIN